jgi:hypothetical protein
MRNVTFPTLLILMLSLVVGALCVAHVSLWGENLTTRYVVHQQKYKFREGLQPFAQKVSVSAPPSTLLAVAAIVDLRCCALRTSPISKAFGAFDSNSNGGVMYYHHLLETCTRDEIASLHAFRDLTIQDASTQVGIQLYPFRLSMWNIFVLKYSGTEGSFPWHYDSEDANDLRILVCLHATDGAGEVDFIGASGDVVTIRLRSGEAYVLSGSQTFHRVTPNRCSDDLRVMIGFHCSSVPDKSTLNLCYFASLTKWSATPAPGVLVRQDEHTDRISTPRWLSSR